MEKNTPISKKGFTLIELVITIAVIGILLGVSMSSFAGSIKKYRATVNKETVIQAKNSFFASNSMDLAEFAYFYFEYEGIVYKGDATGGLTVYNNFNKVNKENLEVTTISKVKIYHPKQDGYYSIEIYLETDIESGEYRLYYTEKDQIGYLNTLTNVLPPDFTEYSQDYSYVLNTDKTVQILITDDPLQNVVKVYYNKVIKVIEEETE